MLVGVLRPREVRAVRVPERRVHPAHDVAHHAVVARARERAVRLGEHGEQLRVVLQHLLEVRHLPLPRRRVTEEPALDVVVHAAARHGAERLVEHRRELRVAVAAVLVEEEAEDLGLWELGLAAEAAELRVVLAADDRPDGIDDLGAQVTRLRGAGLTLLLAHLGDPLGDVAALVAPDVGDLVEVGAHRLGWDVGAPVDDLAVGREERRRRPAAHVVAAVHVGALVVVDADRHVAVVDELDDLGVAVARLVHDVAPVAPDRADREQHWLVRDLRLLERALAPRPPRDLRRAVRARREVELALGRRPFGLLGHGTSFAQPRLSLGYREARLRCDSMIGAAGSVMRGHEFHYATLNASGHDDPLCDLADGQGRPLGPAGARRGNVTGTFFHVVAQP